MERIGPAPVGILWTCSRNIGQDLASWLAMASAPLGNWPTLPCGPCRGDPKRLPPDIDRDSPEDAWPKCDSCGETMIPFEAIYEDY